jgi:hypothetical protein
VHVDRVAIFVNVAPVVVLAGAIQPAAAFRRVVPAHAEDLTRRRDQHRADLPSERARGERCRERVIHELLLGPRRFAEIAEDQAHEAEDLLEERRRRRR